MSTVTALRPQVPDHTICDWLQLQEQFGLACFDSRVIQALWHLSQPQACRRLQAMERHGLVACIQRSRGGHDSSVYVVRGA